jgi:hypothetical protein
MTLSIATIRAMILDGMTDAEITAEIEVADAESAEYADFHEAAYGPADEEDFGGPARFRDDGFYKRNEAGEYSWM